MDCQDAEDGGISDRPGNMSDIFHTYFGIAGLLLLEHFDKSQEDNTQFDDIDPTYALPVRVIERLGVKSQRLFLEK